MGKYKIADMKILMENSGDKTEKRAEKYLYDYEGEPDFKLRIEENEFPEMYESYIEKFPYSVEEFNMQDFIHGFYGTCFAREILEHNGCVLHSSAVAVDGKAYLFSAHSGTGKSTHTSLWLEHFKDRAVIINDDKPCIREINDELYVYGTPWSGKNDISVNDKFKLKAITFICRSDENWIRETSKPEAISLFLTQSYKPRDKKHMDLLLNMIDKIFSKIKIYKMGCNISEEAAKLSYETMSRN
ncbi:MAG: hypothetical protein SPD90_00315 [Intestinibacter sp.]|uniref:hypothetical protein n=1 Tax=Intestinibacter sp. TaxID=1965304 RepID=UPI002A838971|nr:hypothetical protein [Intestinibacter sp.]MDY4573479.1 hypothetical protein [Intestinibacter sp.]